MNSPHHPHHEHHHDVHQQRLLWFFSFCNQRSSSSSGSSTGSGPVSSTRRSGRRKTSASRNKFALQYQQQLQQQQRQSSNVFGLDLIDHTQIFSDEDSIPYIVKSCAKFIEKNGIIFGIYRLSGMRVNIHRLRQDFDKNPKISMIDGEAISNDAHAVACVLKQYFRELPTPLLTFHMYERFIELFKKSNNNNNNNNNNLNNNNSTSNNRNSKLCGTDHQEDKNGLSDDDEDDIITNIDDDDNNTDDLRNREQISKDDNKDSSNYPETNKATIITQSITAKKSTLSAPMTKMNSSSAFGEAPTNSINPNRSKAIKCSPPFTTSASDSQLLSLSSVVTTTTADIKYHVKLEDLKKLLLQLPKPHYQTLKFLMRHLAFIAANGEKTGMDSKNVAIVWAPNLLKPRELELTAGLETLQVIGLQAVITEQLIKHQKFLFDDNHEIEHDHDLDYDIQSQASNTYSPKQTSDGSAELQHLACQVDSTREQVPDVMAKSPEGDSDGEVTSTLSQPKSQLHSTTISQRQMSKAIKSQECSEYREKKTNDIKEDENQENEF